MKSRKRIRSVSPARIKQQREYLVLKANFLTTHSECMVCGLWTTWALRELHHFYGRIGRLLCWEPGFRMVCKWDHKKIHDNPKWARDHGYIAPKGCWNDYVRAGQHLLLCDINEATKFEHPEIIKAITYKH